MSDYTKLSKSPKSALLYYLHYEWLRIYIECSCMSFLFYMDKI